jgi:hypothetical protein
MFGRRQFSRERHAQILGDEVILAQRHHPDGTVFGAQASL